MTKQQLINAIRHQMQFGQFTMGMCQSCDKHPARGGGVCVHCLLKELSELTNEELANDFYLHQMIINEIVDEILNYEKESK